MNIYAINLASSSDRWEALSAEASKFGFDIQRVEAVDGRRIPEANWINFDIQGFRRRNGRHPKPGEYGCYLSHLLAIEQFIESGADSTIILEDDAPIQSDLLSVAQQLEALISTQKAIVKLCSHRTEAFKFWQRIDEKYAIGRCWFGPSGSAAAYFLTRPAALALKSALIPGSLPFDIMLERAWKTGVPMYHLTPTPVSKPRPPSSTIETESTKVATYRKFPFYRRLPAYLFRTKELFLRWIYLVRTEHKHRPRSSAL